MFRKQLWFIISHVNQTNEYIPHLIQSYSESFLYSLLYLYNTHPFLFDFTLFHLWYHFIKSIEWMLQYFRECVCYQVINSKMNIKSKCKQQLSEKSWNSARFNSTLLFAFWLTFPLLWNWYTLTKPNQVQHCLYTVLEVKNL